QALLALDGEWVMWKHNLSNVMCIDWATEDASADCNPQGMVTSLVIGIPPRDSYMIGADYDVPK
ncbi:unnamed protein product, partial [Closterium sp. NIES-53]